MLSINKVMVTGRLTRDPETKYLPSGMAVTNLGIAVNRRFKDKNNEWRDETTFLDVETWGKLAERCAETLKKGRPVYIEGRIKSDTWERDGQKQTKIKISADLVKPFDVPVRGAESQGEEEFGGGSAAGSGSSSGGASSARSGSPSDALDFSDSGMQDDIPF
jgi:single-strand DNA-binding protein